MKRYFFLLVFGWLLSSCQKQVTATETLTGVEKAKTDFTIMCQPYSAVKAGTTTLPHPRTWMHSGSAGNRIAFVAGDPVQDGFYGADIYNVSTGTWTSEPYTQTTEFRSVAGCDSKLAIGGGATGGGVIGVDDVHILDLTSNQWTSAHLSIPRFRVGAVGYGTKIFFAGGINVSGPAQTYSRIDIYDAATNLWSTSELSSPAGYVATAAANNIVAFTGAQQAVGSQMTKNVDLYNIATNQWSHSTISVARLGVTGFGTGALIFFAGGWDASGSSNLCDIYNTVTKTWTTRHLAHNTGTIQISSVGTKVIFRDELRHTPDCYDLCSNSWGTVDLSNDDPGSVVGSADGILLIGYGSMAKYKGGLLLSN